MKLLTHERQWKGGETVVAFGMFDGVHAGHAQLLRRAKELAREQGLTSMVYTFSTHPIATYAPDRVPPQLQTRSEKVRAIGRMGIDAAVLRPFNLRYAAQSPEQFVCALCETLHPRHVVIGYNYSFGARGAGKAEDMVRLGAAYGFETHVIDEISIGGAPVSSTRIRMALLEGELEGANSLLGRPYTLSGVVRRGKQLGRQLDFPTANLAWPEDKAVPAGGVYAAYADVRGERYMAAVNIGSHPTAPQGGRSIEANLLDYDGGEIYGCHMRLSFVKRLREERKFPSLQALREEVLVNREQARRILESESDDPKKC